MANRYSGRAHLLCHFNDNADEYVCVIRVDGERRGEQRVGLPAAWRTLPEYRNGVDSDEAFDSAARAAVSFALGEEVGDGEMMLDDDEVEWDYDLTGPLITRRPPSGSSGQLDWDRPKGRW